MIQVDKYTKAVLTVIAVALVLIAFRVNVTPAKAQDSDDIASIASEVSDLNTHVSNIESDISDIKDAETDVAGGTCTNGKIC